MVTQAGKNMNTKTNAWGAIPALKHYIFPLAFISKALLVQQRVNWGIFSKSSLFV